MAPIIYQGGYLDPQAFFLLDALLTELNAADLQDLSEQLVVWLREHPRLVLVAEQETPSLRRWRLTPWGELVLHEMFDIAVRDHMPAAWRRHRLLGTLRWAEGGRPS